MYLFDEESFFVTTASKIEEIIVETYGYKYLIEEREDISEGAYLVPHIMFGNELDTRAQEVLERFKNGFLECNIIYFIMQDMCNKCVIPEGMFVITTG